MGKLMMMMTHGDNDDIYDVDDEHQERDEVGEYG